MNKLNNICNYGCNNNASFLFKNGKYCCENHYRKCPGVDKTITDNTRQKMRISGIGRKHTEEVKQKLKIINIGKSLDEIIKEKISKKIKNLWKDKESSYNDIHFRKNIKNKNKRTIEKIKEKYPFFSQIEEMRYEPGKENERVIQVHCKNHNCKNSKEQGGWFTPSGRQLEIRISKIENDGLDLSYFYCSDECKNECPLFYSHGNDPFKNSELLYTPSEYQQFRKYILERDNYECQYCGNKAEHVHHERPQKLEPFYSLDPDLSWSCCSKCHYEKGHQDECSTGQIAKKSC